MQSVWMLKCCPTPRSGNRKGAIAETVGTFRLSLTSDCRNARSALDVDTPTQYDFSLGIPAQHHEETCRRARQVYSRNGTAQEASVDGHGAMASHGHTFNDCSSKCSKLGHYTGFCKSNRGPVPAGEVSSLPFPLFSHYSNKNMMYSVGIYLNRSYARIASYTTTTSTAPTFTSKNMWD